MANLFLRLFKNGNGLGITGGATGTTAGLREHGRSAREGTGDPGCLGGGAAPAGGGQPLGQCLCSCPGPSVLQQEVGGHIQVIVRSSQGF